MGKQIKWLILLCVLLFSVFAVTYVLTDFKNEEKKRINEENKITENENVSDTNNLGENDTKIPDSVTGLMIGFDQSDKLTDVMMVGHIDTEENTVKVISVPRDFLIDFRKEPFLSIKKKNPSNKIGYCKLNEIYINMGSGKDGLETLKQVIEEITGISIDYMATINVNGFKDLVDIVGGVEFDVPERMYKVDIYQDPPLRIDLQPGLQLLNGEQAQGLVRFRGYRLGDIQRIKVQQEFVTALFRKIASGTPEQMTQVMKEMFEMVKTDFGLVQVLDYLNYFLDKDIQNLLSTTNMVTLEGSGDTLENGISVLRFSMEKSRETVKELLERKGDSIEESADNNKSEK